VTPPGRIAPPDGRFPAMLGMKLDPAGRLWIVGGFTGLITIVNPHDGQVVKQMKVPTTPTSLLNDLQIVDGFAYVTDTFTPTLWRVAASGDKIGEIEPWLDLRGSPIAFADGPNLNGIAATADGKALIVVQMNKGLLFKIDLATKAITPIDVGGADLTGADGLVLDGPTLYVVRQWAGEIVTVSLDKGLISGTVVSRFKDPGLTYPATAVMVGDDLVLANAQFDKHDAGGAQRPFSLVRVPRARLAAKP
jgi:Cu-Zn family superoxide dismutase